MSSSLSFQRLEAEDLFEIERQESQLTFLGSPGDITQEAAEVLASQDIAWTAWAGGRILACFGISELFHGMHGLAWALLGRQLGVHHLALTRFMQGAIRDCGLVRLELLARANDDLEDLIDMMAAQGMKLDGAQLVAAAMARPTPECRWAKLLGFEAAHVLRFFGAAAETHMLFERFDLPGEAEIY